MCFALYFYYVYSSGGSDGGDSGSSLHTGELGSEFTRDLKFPLSLHILSFSNLRENPL